MFSAAGVGYYHILTKDAYQIIEVRLKKRRDQKIGTLNCLNCCCYICTFYCCTDAKRKLESEILELSDMITTVQLRRYAVRPVGDLDLPKEVVERNEKRSTSGSNTQPNPNTSSTHECYGVPYIFVEAAACGGGSPADGGGCGGYVFHCIFEIFIYLTI